MKTQTKTKAKARPSKTGRVLGAASTRSPAPKKRRTLAARRKPAGRKAPYGETGRHPRKKVGGDLSWPWWIPLSAASVLGLAAILWSVQQPMEPPKPFEPAAREPASTAQQMTTPTLTAPETKPAEPAKETKVPPSVRRFEDMSSLSPSERMRVWSEALAQLDKPSGLAAWVGKPQDLPEVTDSAPLIPNRFDCTTFVETTMALARSHTSADFYKQLLSIRYKDAHPDYFSRNHFPEADWIPNNAKAGILRDVTAQVAQSAGSQSLIQTKVIDRGHWYSNQKKFVKKVRMPASEPDPEWAKPVEVSLPYITLAEARRIVDKIPSGLVLNFVQGGTKHSPVMVIHQGILVRESGKLMLRHASIQGAMMTVDFLEYLENKTARDDGEGRLRAVVGINLNEVLG